MTSSEQLAEYVRMFRYKYRVYISSVGGSVVVYCNPSSQHPLWENAVFCDFRHNVYTDSPCINFVNLNENLSQHHVLQRLRHCCASQFSVLVLNYLHVLLHPNP